MGNVLANSGRAPRTSISRPILIDRIGAKKNCRALRRRFSNSMGVINCGGPQCFLGLEDVQSHSVLVCGGVSADAPKLLGG